MKLCVFHFGRGTLMMTTVPPDITFVFIIHFPFAARLLTAACLLLWPLFLIPSYPDGDLPLNSYSVGFVTRIV